MKMERFATVGTSILLLLNTGCSLLMPSHQTVTVQVAEPPHARVWVNGNYEGEAPVQVSMLRNHSVGVIVKKEGFQTSSQQVGYHLNAVGALDIVRTWVFLLPVIGIISPGSHTLDKTVLVFHLVPEDTPMSPTNAPPTVASTNAPAEMGVTNASPAPIP